MRARVILAVLVLAAGATMVWWSLARGPSQSTVRSGQETPWQKSALWVQERDGKARPFQNGQTVTVGDVNVEVFIAPYPPVREGSIDLYVTDRATGKPASDGDLEIIFDMDMPHGSIRAQAMPTGGGHYLIPYKLVMPGEWRVDISIASGADAAALALIFRVE
ncbi:MAG: FixH family protein [Armatimonadetes bacterium]|nr:FixH family protein [Armatimonadota bacterium]